MKKEWTDDEVIKFLMDEANRGKCKDCPYNVGQDSGADHNQLPCGQYNCWVTVHTGKR